MCTATTPLPNASIWRWAITAAGKSNPKQKIKACLMVRMLFFRFYKYNIGFWGFLHPEAEIKTSMWWLVIAIVLPGNA
ncbi:hypothetical protein D3C87_1054330 [compost metagenome]